MDFYDFRVDLPYNNELRILRMSQMRMANNDLYVYVTMNCVRDVTICVTVGVITVKKTLKHCNNFPVIKSH